MQSFMKKLYGGSFDREMYHYLLQSLVQKATFEFEHHRVFPSLQDLEETSEELQLLKAQFDAIENRNKSWTGDVGEDFQLQYHVTLSNDTAVYEMKEWINDSIPSVVKARQKGEGLRSQLGALVQLVPLGLKVMYDQEGVLLTKVAGSDKVLGWSYRFSLGTLTKSKAYVSSQCLGWHKISLTHSMMDVKRVCMEKAGFAGSVVQAWLAESSIPLPMIHTIKPIALEKLGSAHS